MVWKFDKILNETQSEKKMTLETCLWRLPENREEDDKLVDTNSKEEWLLSEKLPSERFEVQGVKVDEDRRQKCEKSFWFRYFFIFLKASDIAKYHNGEKIKENGFRVFKELGDSG